MMQRRTSSNSSQVVCAILKINALKESSDSASVGGSQNHFNAKIRRFRIHLDLTV